MTPSPQRARKSSTPSENDRRRYHAFKSGTIVVDIAEQEGVKVSTIEESIRKVRSDNQRYSSEETSMQVRKMLLQHLPKAFKVLDEAMDATKLESRQIVAIDALGGKTVQLQESVRVADHDVRLKAHGEYRGLIAVVQPREPFISIDQRSQTNIMSTTTTPVTPNSLTSPEAVIRAIRAQRGLALADGDQAVVVDAVVEEESVDGEDDELDDEDEGDDGA